MSGSPPEPPELHREGPTSPNGEPIEPAIVAWARQQFSEAEILAGLHELRTGGGLELKDFLDELEQEATPRE